MAAHVEQSIGEVDVVAFERPIKKVDGAGNWPTGTEGTIVSDYGDRKEVEISNDAGEAIDYVIVPVEHLKLIEKHS
jgi:ribosomal protein L21E